MKIEQLPEFQPIKITMETHEEAAIFWDFIGECIQSGNPRTRELASVISDWFSNHAQLGGRK